MIKVIVFGLICGVLLGFVMQRGRFCITGAYRDLYLIKDARMFIAMLLAISIQSIGVFLLYSFGFIQLSATPFTWVAAIVGGFIFGIGIVLAGGCATGTWYRAGEGLIGSWIALFGYMLSSATTKFGALKPINDAMTSVKAKDITIYETLHVSPWILVVVLAIITSYFVWKQANKPKVTIPSLKPRKKGVNHLLFEKRWHPFFTATLVGLIAILAWPLSEATGRIHGLGITTPSANLFRFFVTGDLKAIDWGVFLILGIFVGSLFAAKMSSEFRWRVPDSKTSILSFVGGLLMGFGAGIAGGCSIGNGLVNTAIFSWQGWMSLPFMIFGTWTATYFLMVRPRMKTKQMQRSTVKTVS